ncbi:MAG: hypothetical protein J6O04_03710, partial [Selenomonadaceae bacterium]|nr:hypothetical protein [Selenomonadaceae bacterium]
FADVKVKISRSSASPERGGGPRSGGGVDREKLCLNLLYSIINFYETAVHVLSVNEICNKKIPFGGFFL